MSTPSGKDARPARMSATGGHAIMALHLDHQRGQRLMVRGLEQPDRGFSHGPPASVDQRPDEAARNDEQEQPESDLEAALGKADASRAPTGAIQIEVGMNRIMPISET